MSVCKTFSCRPSEALQEDPRLVFPMLEASFAQHILAKFEADSGGHLSDSETRYWARLLRLYEGDEDAFDAPEHDAEDEEYERIAALVAEHGEVRVGAEV